MAHIETAYRLGTRHAERDFEAYLKEAATLANVPPGAPHPASPPAVAPPAIASTPSMKPFNPAAAAQQQVNKAIKPMGSTTPGGTGNASTMAGTNISGTGNSSGGQPQGAPG